MEAYVSQLMDQVLARRAARAAEATLKAAPTLPVQQPEDALGFDTPLQPAVPTTAAPTAAAPPLTSQRPIAGAGSSPFWTPSAARTAMVSSLNRGAGGARSEVSAGAVYPTQTWQGLQVFTLALQGNDSLIAALASGSIIEVDAVSHSITANYSYDPSLAIGGLAASRTAAYLVLLDELYGNCYIDGVDVRSGERRSRVTLNYPTMLGGLDASGRTALTSAGGSAAVLYDTTSGARRGLLYDPAWTVLALALNPVNNEVWLASGSNGSFSLQVLKAGSNATRASAPLPSTILALGSVSIDPEGANAYVLYVTLHNGSAQFIIEQFDAQSGQSVAQLVLPASAQPGQFIAAGAQPGSVYWVNGGVITLTTSQGSSSAIQLGPYHILSEPTDVAVTREGTVLVAENLPFQLLEFNSSGGLLQSYPSIDEFAAGCDFVPYVNVAVEEWSGHVLMPVCNATILVFDRSTREVTALSTGKGSVPRAVAAGPRGSILFTDDTHSTRLQQMARNGTLERTWTTPFNNSRLMTVHWDNSTHSAWATDMQNLLVLQWPILQSAPPKLWNLTAIYGRPLLPYSAVVDPVHQQLIVTAGSGDLSAAWVLWLSLQGQRPLANFSFPLSPFLPFVIPTGVAVSPDGSRVYATDAIAGAVYVFDNDQISDSYQHHRMERVQPIATTTIPTTSSARAQRIHRSLRTSRAIDND